MELDKGVGESAKKAMGRISGTLCEPIWAPHHEMVKVAVEVGNVLDVSVPRDQGPMPKFEMIYMFDTVSRALSCRKYRTVPSRHTRGVSWTLPQHID